MRIGRNHEAVVIHVDDIDELNKLIETLRPLTNLIFPVSVFISDGRRTIRVNSLKGFVATLRLEDIEEKEEGA